MTGNIVLCVITGNIGLCVITGNTVFSVVPKLVQKNLFEINLKKLFLICSTKLKILDCEWEKNNNGRGREVSVTQALLLHKHFCYSSISQAMLRHQLLIFNRIFIIST